MNDFERKLRETLQSDGESGVVSSLHQSIRHAIGGRSPHELNVARTGRALRRGSGVAGVLWAVLVVCTWSVDSWSADRWHRSSPSQASVAEAPADLLYQEASLFDSTEESTILTAMLGEGLNP